MLCIQKAKGGFDFRRVAKVRTPDGSVRARRRGRLNRSSAIFTSALQPGDLSHKKGSGSFMPRLLGVEIPSE